MFALLAASTLLSPLFGLFGFAVAYKNGANPLAPSILVGTIMGVLAMGYTHNAVGDITRYADYVALLRGLPLNQAFSSEMRYASYPVATIWFWLIAQTGVPQLLKFTIVFPQYAVASYVILDYARENSFSTNNTAVAMLLLLIANPLFNVMSSVRSTPALALILLATYLELYKQTHLAWLIPLYVVAALLHSVAYAAIALRVLHFVGKRSWVFAAAMAAFSIPLLSLLGSFLQPLSNYLNVDLYGKLTFYSSWESGWAAYVAESSYYQTLKITHILTAALCASRLISIGATQSKANAQEGDYSLTVFAVEGLALIVGIALSIQVPSYLRITYFIYPIVICLLVDNTLESQSSKIIILIERLLLVLSSVLLSYLYLRAFVSHVVLREFLRVLFSGLLGL